MAQSYPEPSRRLCGDIDLLVDGRRKDVMAWLRTQCEIGYVTWHHVEAKLFEDVEVEVHFFPIWLYNPFRNWRLQRYFKEQTAAQMVERETGFGYPSVEFNAIYSLVHTFHHLMDEGVGLRHVVDYFYVLRQFQDCPSGESAHARDKSNKLGSPLAQSQTSGFFAEQSGRAERKVQDLRNILHHLGLAKFAGAMMYVMKEACGMASEELLCEPDEEAGKFLLEEIMQAGNFGYFDARTVRPENETFWQRNIRKFKRQLRFVKYYPGEVFSAPLWKTWHKAWRIKQR